MVSKGVHEHEANMHAGHPRTKLKLRAGGKVHGSPPSGRPDRQARGGGLEREEEKVHDLPNDAQGNKEVDSRLARGGRHDAKKGKTIINIDASHKGDPEKVAMAIQQGAQRGGQAVAAKLGACADGGPPRPPMGCPHPAGMPPGALHPEPWLAVPPECLPGLCPSSSYGTPARRRRSSWRNSAPHGRRHA